MISCKCPSCGAELDFDTSRDYMFCSYCGGKVLKQNVVHIENINVSTGILDADTMFENWLITRDKRLQDDFKYYYATDKRNIYVQSFANFRELNLQNINEIDDEKYIVIDKYIQ